MTDTIPPTPEVPPEHAWNGSPITFARDRVFKYTDADVKARFGSFEPDTVAALLALPCVFAYEEPVGKPSLFGRLTHILPAGHGVKLDYEIVPVDPFLTAADWEKAGGELGIRGRFERFHTHWALKEVDLAQVLAARGINLPRVSGRPRIDIETHHFDVALSFPGEKRALVDRIRARGAPAVPRFPSVRPSSSARRSGRRDRALEYQPAHSPLPASTEHSRCAVRYRASARPEARNWPHPRTI